MDSGRGKEQGREEVAGGRCGCRCRCRCRRRQVRVRVTQVQAQSAGRCNQGPTSALSSNPVADVAIQLLAKSRCLWVSPLGRIVQVQRTIMHVHSFIRCNVPVRFQRFPASESVASCQAIPKVTSHSSQMPCIHVRTTRVSSDNSTQVIPQRRGRGGQRSQRRQCW